MHPEEIFDELEILVNGLPFDLPHHEDGGIVYPFAWNSSSVDEFNSFNLLQANDWIKLTDANVVIKQFPAIKMNIQLFTKLVLGLASISIYSVKSKGWKQTNWAFISKVILFITLRSQVRNFARFCKIPDFWKSRVSVLLLQPI